MVVPIESSPIRELSVKGFSLAEGRRMRQRNFRGQVRAPRRQRFSGTGSGLPDDFDLNAEIEVLPGAVRGEGCGLALDG